MRHIVLDTESTGLDAEGGDRIIEIGALELINYVPTGKVYHQYINPECPISPGAMAVHGITDKDVADKPVYAEIVAAFDEFIGDSPLVIHNAEFDMRFLNAEYKRLGFQALPKDRAIDTLLMARQMFPGAPASLDALCKRYNVDLSGRTLHGALLDARLLADVYLHMIGGHQPDLLGGDGPVNQLAEATDGESMGTLWPARQFVPVPEEEAAFREMLEGIKDPLWTKTG
jgi:DNA polymerase-3 subunit epsilon